MTAYTEVTIEGQPCQVSTEGNMHCPVLKLYWYSSEEALAKAIRRKLGRDHENKSRQVRRAKTGDG